ncbi:MAG: gluconate 2-dehydrogenase subunit 3 family protein [Chryseolinea sp.]
MDRRTSLRTLAAATVSLVALPSWANAWTANNIAASPAFLSVGQQEILASITDTIIPEGNSIGALSVGVDKFVQRLLENCYETNVQENVKKQLAALDAAAVSAGQTTFVTADQTSRMNLLLKFAASQVTEEKDFFDLMKAETIRGFNTSKEVMMGHLKYKMVPGHYYGCVDITS